MNASPRRFVYAIAVAATLAASAWVVMLERAPDSHEVVWLNAYSSSAR